MKTKTNVIATIEELEHLAKIAARIVSLYGDVYLPIFKRVHDELTKARETQDQKSLAMQLAISYDPKR